MPTTDPWTRRDTIKAVAGLGVFGLLIYAGAKMQPDTTRPEPPRDEYEREWGR